MGNENLNGMKLISSSRHQVYSNGEFFLKKARNNENAHEIVLEYSVQKALGQDAKLFPGPPVSVMTPNLGVQLTGLDSETVNKQADVIQSMKNIDSKILEDISQLAPDINTIRSSIKSRMTDRINDNQAPEYLANLMPKELDVNKFELTLVHADPRPENWVRNNQGGLILIDWESACFAPWEFGLASLVSHTIEYGYPHLVSTIISEVSRNNTVNYSLYEWAMRLRAVSITSWYYYDEGKESGDKWYRRIMDNMY